MSTDNPVNRFAGFTEAVPLSLSSMAHLTNLGTSARPLDRGVVDGLEMVVHHALQSCVAFAAKTISTTSSNVNVNANPALIELTTNEHAWKVPETVSATTPTTPAVEPSTQGIPPALQKLKFQYQYTRTAFVLVNDSSENKEGKTPQVKDDEDEWYLEDNRRLARISLVYATPERLTLEELQGTEPDDEDTPPCVLIKAVVEYKSWPSSGSKTAVSAEELSMLSFGGFDDLLKYGALAGLYDPYAKYGLEIWSVRGKKYKFDLMDSTLSDGTVPRLPTKNKSASKESKTEDESAMQLDPPSSHSMTTPFVQDPFVKSLCVTVTDHDLNKAVATKVSPTTDGAETSAAGEGQLAENATTTAPYSITRIQLTLEGGLRCTALSDLPNIHYVPQQLQAQFLTLQTKALVKAKCSPSGHTLLLDPEQAGKIYIQGHYVTTWSPENATIGSHVPALFGMNLHSVPYWHGQILDYHVLKRTYSQLWQEILIDARYLPLGIGNKLLSRLATGRDPKPMDDDAKPQSMKTSGG